MSSLSVEARTPKKKRGGWGVGRGSKWIWYGSARNWNCDHGSDATDEYLKEVRGDLAKDEEYFGRAILASPADGDILSLYADII
ncbi:hypothetical protein QQ045_015374 [Rhodiola kirilowii]